MPESRPARGERELLRRLSRLLPPAASESVPFGDDMAGVPGTDLLWTTDMLMDGIDFDSRVHGWAAIGRKAMAVNLSDCAAMGATPVAALAAVALNDSTTMDDALELLAAVQACGAEFGCPLVGGDTNSWSAPLVISISMAARCERPSGPVRRDGARPGDRVWLTGRVGGSILGRHLTFTPRVELGRRIGRELNPHAMIDISDGLALDLDRLLEASGCGAVLEGECLAAAIHPDAVELSRRDGRSALEHALHDGEDFELIAALPPDSDAAARGLGLIPIGRFVSKAGVWLENGAARRRVAPRGWEHFTGGGGDCG